MGQTMNIDGAKVDELVQKGGVFTELVMSAENGILGESPTSPKPEPVPGQQPDPEPAAA